MSSKMKNITDTSNKILDRYGDEWKIYAVTDTERKEIDVKTFEKMNKVMSDIKKPQILFKIFTKHLFYEELLINKKPISISARNVLIKDYLHLKGKFKYYEVSYLDKKILIDNLFFLMFKEIFLNDQYNIKSSNIKNKIVIDIGANVGVFSIFAAISGAKKIYAFEPVSKTFEILKKNIKINNLEDKIIVINEGLGEKEKEEYIKFNFAGDGTATVNKNLKKKNEKNKVKIKITTLDNFVKQNKIPKVDFIKIDVEGYEENVLLGAKETIKKWKPILSFSAYHLPTDKERLPKIVKSIRPDYKIKLNKFAEEDFYCE